MCYLTGSRTGCILVYEYTLTSIQICILMEGKMGKVLSVRVSKAAADYIDGRAAHLKTTRQSLLLAWVMYHVQEEKRGLAKLFKR